MVKQRDALLDAWAAQDDWRKRTTVHQYSLLVNEPREIAARLKDFLGETPHAFTQWIAGWLRHPYTLPPVVTAYVNRFPDAAALENKLLARRVEDGGRLWLVVPKDEGLAARDADRGWFHAGGGRASISRFAASWPARG